MSSKPVISVRGVNKVYRIYKHPLHRLLASFSVGRWDHSTKFSALNGVSFDVHKGETIGILGRNGAGKSTLLQIICSIRRPTSGTISVNGRISALLELGSGFQPEFTGRENVYLQGAVLGFSRQEMAQRFDEIAAFADIGEYIDQPVKVYSSGMFMRLAFSVATSVEADIIIIDEAMAVGDIAFQAKCFQRIKQLKERGTAFLLVTHSSAQILNNADRALLLEQGEIIDFSSDVKTVIAQYEERARNSQGRTAQFDVISTPPNVGGTTNLQDVKITHGYLIEQALKTRRNDLHENRFGTHEATITSVAFFQEGGSTGYLVSGRKTVLRFLVSSSRIFNDVVLGASIRLPGTSDLWGDNNLLAEQPISLHVGFNQIEYTFTLPLTGGDYLLYCGLAAFESEGRIELDQRWPLEKIFVISDRPQLGYIYAPITVNVET